MSWRKREIEAPGARYIESFLKDSKNKRNTSKNMYVLSIQASISIVEPIMHAWYELQEFNWIHKEHDNKLEYEDNDINWQKYSSIKTV